MKLFKRIFELLNLIIRLIQKSGFVPDSMEPERNQQTEIQSGFLLMEPVRRFQATQINRNPIESDWRMLRRKRLILFSASHYLSSQPSFYKKWFRRCEMPPGSKRLKSANRIRQMNILLMRTRLRILRWLSLLPLPAGMVRESGRELNKERFRKPDAWFETPKMCSLKNIRQIIQKFNRSLKIQLMILHWLCLLQLSQNSGWQIHNLAHFSWFRRP